MTAGQIVWIDFRKKAVPNDANKLRPGIVVEASTAFTPRFPNVVIVPCTTRLTFEVPSLCVRIEPDDENGLETANWAIAHGVMSTSKSRIVRTTENFVTREQLAAIRARILITLGVA